MAKANDKGSHHVQSLARGLSVIAAFDASHPELSLTEVADRTGLTRAAARRFLLTLTDLGYARQDGRLFTLTPRVLELGYSYLSSQSLPEVAQPHLERLVAEVNESSSVSVLDDDHVVYVARVATSHRIMAVRINVGTRFPAAMTSMGRVLLAGLTDDELERHLRELELPAFTSKTITTTDELRDELLKIREAGFAIVDQELEEGLRSVAVPIRDHDGMAIAAANLSTHASRTSMKAVRQELLPPLLGAAGAIEKDLRLTPGQRGTG